MPRTPTTRGTRENAQRFIEYWIAGIFGVAFFMPWFSFAGIFTIAGYRIPTLVRSLSRLQQELQGQSAQVNWADIFYLLWLIPLLACAMAAQVYRAKSVRVLQFVGGLLAIAPFVYLFLQAPSDMLRGLNFGAYLQIGGAILCITASWGMLEVSTSGKLRGDGRVVVVSVLIAVIGGCGYSFISRQRDQSDFLNGFRVQQKSDRPEFVAKREGKIVAQVWSNLHGEVGFKFRAYEPSDEQYKVMNDIDSMKNAIYGAQPTSIDEAVAILETAKRRVEDADSYYSRYVSFSDDERIHYGETISEIDRRIGSVIDCLERTPARCIGITRELGKSLNAG